MKQKEQRHTVKQNEDSEGSEERRTGWVRGD